MADRYWVGGAGTWDATTTTNWSATSGGAGGASAPTSVDNVFFNTLSNATAYAVTVGTNAAAQDITIAGPLVGNVTITSGATAVINCYGSWTSAATGVVFTSTTGAALNFLATTTGKTVTTNNVTIGALAPTFNGAGGGWTLGSAFTATAVFTVTSGAFNTANFAMTVSSLTASTSATRSYSLGSSAISCAAATPINITNPTGLTFNAGTSTITITGTNTTLNGGGFTYYNVTYSGTANGTSTIQGANTFNNLTQTTTAATGLRTVVFGASQTINGILTLGATNTAIRRVQVVGTTLTGLGVGTPITLTVATIATLSDVNFRDITAAGASGTWSGTRLGNAGGNSNITFAAGVSKYWNLAAGGGWTATAWALTSGGAVDVNNFPLAQDTVIIENTGLTAGNTITVNENWFIGTINASTRTNAFTLASSTAIPAIFGSYTIPSVATITGTGVWYFQGVGATQTITTNGVSIPFPINCNGSTTNIVRLSGNLTIANNVTFQQGTLDLNSNTLTVSLQFAGSGTGVRTLAFGATGKIVLTGTAATLFTTSVATNLTVTGTNPLIQLTTNATTGARGIIFGAAGETNAISVDVTLGSDTVNLSTTNGAYKSINFTGFTGTINFSNGILVFGSFDAGGATAITGTSSPNFSATSGAYTVRSNSLTFASGMTFSGIGGAWTLLGNLTLTGALAFTGGTLNLGSYTISCTNVGASGTNTRAINFGTGKIVVTGTNQTVWTSSVSTGLTMTGSRTVEVTGNGLAGETRSVTGGAVTSNGNANNAANFYIKAGADIINLGTAFRVYGTLDFTGFSGSTITNASPQIYGDLVLSTGMTVSPSANIWGFVATTSQTITSNGKTIDAPVTFDGVGGTWTLQDALTIGPTRLLQLNTGTLTTNGYAVSCGKFQSLGSGLGARTLNLGASAFTCVGTTGSTASWEVADDAFALTINAGTSTIYMAEPFTGASQQYFLGGSKTYYNVVYSGGEEGGFYGNNTFNSISNSAQPLTLGFEAGSTQTVNNFNVSGTAGNLVTLQSETPGTQWNLVKATGSKVVVSYSSITDSNVTPTPGYWFAPTSQGNVDGGNNTGWDFGSAGNNSSFMLLM